MLNMSTEKMRMIIYHICMYLISAQVGHMPRLSLSEATRIHFITYIKGQCKAGHKGSQMRFRSGLGGLR